MKSAFVAALVSIVAATLPSRSTVARLYLHHLVDVVRDENNAHAHGGAFRVGPRSAGAAPGPAAYGMGGEEPTVTDANLVLGRLDADDFLGGGMKLDAEAARRAVSGLAAKLGLDLSEAAEGIITVINANMANAIRSRTIQKGIDPRGFSLVAFGGAGPLQGAESPPFSAFPK